MIIVGGTFEVEPHERDRFLAEHHDMMRRSRAEAGCLEYTFSADPLDPSRVLLFERWESEEVLDAHLSALRARPRSPDAEVSPKTASITLYDVTGERSLGG
ncbi:MAG: putative quinol monooxygenase [Acidimicrobiales bacterium]